MARIQLNQLIKFTIFTTIIYIGVIQSANAAKKKPKPLETYSATEEELSSDEGTANVTSPPPPKGLTSTVTKIEKKSPTSIPAPVVMPASNTQNKPQGIIEEPLNDRVQALEKEMETLKNTKTAPTTATEPKVIFDNVPDHQKSGVIKRLELVAELIKRHGRAYDYRQHTLKELRSIIAELDDRSFDSRANNHPIQLPAQSATSDLSIVGTHTQRITSHMMPNSY